MSTSSTFGIYTLVHHTTADGSFSWVPPVGITSYDVLVVAGGGGGGAQAQGGGAGGAGGLLWLTAQSCTPGVGISGSVGAGGAGSASFTVPGTNGTDSVFGSSTAVGGGGGGAGTSGTSPNNGKSGGSGGGGAGSSAGVSSGGSGTGGQGNNGAAGSTSGTAVNRAAGGGGGASAAGSAAVSGAAGAGGAGTDLSASLGTAYGASGVFAGGGGGGKFNTTIGGVGGAGGGGRGGASTSPAGVAGTANTGGGGGGSGNTSASGDGGSGVVIVRYVTPQPQSAATISATDTITSTGVVGKAIGAALAATVAITATGVVGTSSDASISETATITAAGDVLAANESPAALDITDTITATGVVGRSTDATLAGTAAITATGATGTSSGAAIDATAGITAAGARGYASGASLSAAATITAAGQVDEAGSSAATITATVEITAEGVVVSYDTDSTNADDGVWLGDGYAQVVWEPDVVPVPAHLSTATDQARIVAKVIDTAPTFVDGVYTAAVAREAWIAEPLDRVLIDDEDVTFLGGAAAIVDSYRLIDPLLYGTTRITLPSINPQFENHAALVTKYRFARVRLQRRTVDGALVAKDYKGFVTRVDVSGTTLSLDVGGEASGALSQMYVPPAVYRHKQDVEHILADLLRDARVQAHEHEGESGIGLIRRGGSDGLSIFNETLAVWAGAADQPVTWTPNDDGEYRKTQKTLTGPVDFTAYPSDLVEINLAQDFAEQYTRVYAHGYTEQGELVTNIKTPGLTQGSVNFETDEDDFDIGEASSKVLPMQYQLMLHNFLDINDVEQGDYDEPTQRAVLRFKKKAGFPLTTAINEEVWRALFDLSRTGYTLDDSREYPMAQDIRTLKWLRTANGSRLRENPDYDPHFVPNDVFFDVGGPFSRDRIESFAESKMVGEDGIWSGTIILRSGLVIGPHFPTDALTDALVADRRDVLPNHRIRLPWFGGTGTGIVVFVAGVEHGPAESQLLVSSVPQTTMETWEALERRREAKSNPGRAWSGHTRASQVRNDVATQWDNSSGWIAHQQELIPGWTTVAIPAGQSGIVQEIEVQLSSPMEFACALTSKPPSGLPANPLLDPRPEGDTAEGDWDEELRPWWERVGVVAVLKEAGLLDAWGTPEQPCGYDPSLKADNKGLSGSPRTGLFQESAGLNYTTGEEPVLYLSIWTPIEGGTRYLQPGRVLRNQRTTDF